MQIIRHLIRISNFDGVTSILQSVKRGGWIGLQWGHFIGVIACGVIPSIVLTVSLAMIAYWGSLSRLGEKGVPWQLLGGLLVIYALCCGWGSGIGAILAPLCYAIRRRNNAAITVD